MHHYTQKHTCAYAHAYLPTIKCLLKWPNKTLTMNVPFSFLRKKDFCKVS